MEVHGGAQKICCGCCPKALPLALPGCPTTGSSSLPPPLAVPPYLIELLSSSICSRSRCASSWRAARSCCSLQMYSAVFCKVVALLTCRGAGLRQQKARGLVCPTAKPWKSLQQAADPRQPGHDSMRAGAAWGHTIPRRCPVPRAGQLVCSALHAYLDAGLGAQRAHQAVQCVKAQLDVEASLLLGGDVCDTPAFYLWASTVRHLLAAEVAPGLLPRRRWADPKLAVRPGVNSVGQQGRGCTWRCCPRREGSACSCHTLLDSGLPLRDVG